MPHIRTQDIGDAEIQYLEYPGEGPTVIMLHATGFQPWLWHPVARELAGGCRVIAPYICDHRVADPDEGGLSWRLVASDIFELLGRLDVKRPVMVGHSMGATVASIIEATEGPLAAGLVLIEPIFLPSAFYEMNVTVDQHPLAAMALRRRSSWEGESEARDYLHSKKLFAGWDDEALELYLAHGMNKAQNGALTLACQPRREAAIFMGGAYQDPWPLLESISCPVLLVEGAESENREFVDMARAAATIPGASLRVVPGAGHLILMEKPGEVLALIREFLDSAAP